jgi:hypothetical protein
MSGTPGYGFEIDKSPHTTGPMVRGGGWVTPGKETRMRKWLRKILGIEELETKLRNAERINTLLKVGVDFSPMYNESWAVVCVQGKPEFISFVRLPANDTMAVIRFLKQFEPQNRIVDLPHGVSRQFFDI